MKKLLFLLFVAFTAKGFAQCDTNTAVLSGKIDWVTSETSDSASYVFDNDPATFWMSSSEKNQELSYDFGKEVNLNGVFANFRYSNRNKANHVVVHTSDDGHNWKLQHVSGDLFYLDEQYAQVNFGTITTRLVKLTFSAEAAIHITEIGFLEDSCPNGGLKNSVITFTSIKDRYTQVGEFNLNASEVNGQPVVFVKVQGAGTVSGSKFLTNGEVGAVTIAALSPEGNGYYEGVVFRTFMLYDEKEYAPDAYLSVTDDYSIELKTWEAYPIYVRSGINDALGEHKIDRQALYIDGVEVTLSEEEGLQAYGSYLWQPKEYKTYEVKFVVDASNGESATVTENIEVVKGAESQQVTTLEDVIIWFQKENSRNFQNTYTLPQHVGVYDKITANLEVECPDGNCDDWDRWAYIDVMAPDGNWIQIIRYITPFGVACDHSIDLTQYASILQGNVPMRVFIDTWGTGGWQLTLTFDFQAGEPEYLYSSVKEIWDGAYDFGNPGNLQPVEETEFILQEGVEDAKLYLSTTGHGWGENNSNNAAEFYNANHTIDLNGTGVYQQNLWDRCNPNPDACTGQRGTWQYDRAGWCPGSIAAPDVFDLMDVVEGDNIKLHYRFDEAYMDDCHPNNPDCKTGTTCKDCNAGYNPHYQIDGHAITYSNKVLLLNGATYASLPDYQKDALDFTVYPSPAQQHFKLSGLEVEGRFKVIVKSIDGRSQAFYYFENAEAAMSQSFNISTLDAGVYFIQVEGENISGYQSLIVE